MIGNNNYEQWGGGADVDIKAAAYRIHEEYYNYNSDKK